MKYKSECWYRGKEVSTPANGLMELLKSTNGANVIIKIQVRRRERLDNYIEQIILGVQKNKQTFVKYMPTTINIEDYVRKVLTDKAIDKTAWFQENIGNKQVIGYYEIIVAKEDLIK